MIATQETVTGSAAVMIAAIGSVTSVLLAVIAGGFTLWNNKIARRAELTANRTEHTVNSKTTALETKIAALEARVQSLIELDAAKDATIAAQIAPAVGGPMPVVVVDTEKPIEVDVVSKRKP